MVIGNIRFNSYDLGGHEQARKTWREYAGSVDGIVFMIDAADINRLVEAKIELENLLSMHELAEVPVLVFGNKFDRKEALKEEEFRDVMGLPHHLTKGKDPN